MRRDNENPQHLRAFLRGSAFVVLTWNGSDPNPHGPFEAWAYHGALDFDAASPLTFGVGEDPLDALSALDCLLGSLDVVQCCGRCPATRTLGDRELATILAALRFHQAENLQSGADIYDLDIRDIATNAGTITPLNFEEVSRLCERLNSCGDNKATDGLTVNPPHQESGKEPLFRVVYTIDLNAASPSEAAKQAYRTMIAPDSLPPVLDVLDHLDQVTRFDLSDERTEKGGEKP